MTVAPPMIFNWDGEVMRPCHPKLADRHYIVGEEYRLVESLDRSPNSHSHYFANLHEAWLNLPETISFEFPTEDHLRKRALIATGFRDERSIVCSTRAEALRFAAFIKPLDDYVVVAVHECAVVVWTAKSQSMRAMGREDFQKSKDAVLGYVWALVGVEPNEAAKHVGAA